MSLKMVPHISQRCAFWGDIPALGVLSSDNTLAEMHCSEDAALSSTPHQQPPIQKAELRREDLWEMATLGSRTEEGLSSFLKRPYLDFWSLAATEHLGW